MILFLKRNIMGEERPCQNSLEDAKKTFLSLYPAPSVPPPPQFYYSKAPRKAGKVTFLHVRGKDGMTCLFSVDKFNP